MRLSMFSLTALINASGLHGFYQVSIIPKQFEDRSQVK